MDPPRRSHASLKHLSITPLTPSYPLPPSSPSPPLGTSKSYSYLASPTYPSKPTVLSRSSSRTRLRSGHGPQPVMTSKSSSALPIPSTQPIHYKRASATAVPTSASLITSPAQRVDEESSWLLRTASTLQSQRMEEKGQVWLATRNSSTSLATIYAPDTAGDDFSPYPHAYSQSQSPMWPRTPAFGRSRIQSHYASRVPSRLGSRAPSRAGSDGNMRGDGLRALTKASEGLLEGGNMVKGFTGPDFVDSSVFDEEEEGVGEKEVDVSEMRKVIMGRAKGWADWAVCWMDLRGEEELWEGSDDEPERAREDQFELKGDLEERRRRKRKEPDDENDSGNLRDHVASEPPPPDENAGVVADAKWLLGVASKLIL